ncbi:P-loop containing nucleoside triphosphate hydrolase protein [Choiromyces venosus 120613-1]|uniref:P-loop containing nucleoside triphosphate hydrolase protein n=1 Tax=Choiromyces venosus 120613-1 TaxID=1336337 RepID=A0A3N4JTH2_9PEZI|nr:P-loop containing nucleoside triphosphate hydrolase protein [Choiromyces venosus 120613-1]
MLLGERIRSFTLSLLSERFNDMKSRTAVARIVLSAVKLSDPAALVHFGVKLGALPWILRILFAEGHIKQLSLTHRQHLEQLVSEPRATEQWTEVVMNLCGECEVHRSGPMRASGLELAKFIRTVPCGYCPKMSPDGGPEQDAERESMRVRDHAPRSNIESNVFEHLLGDHLGEWKIILSQQAMLDLAQLNFQGIHYIRQGDHFKNVRRKFYELASGDWAGDGKLLHSAKWNNGRSYRIPVFKAFYATGHFILWQIDTAFDERFGNDYQVIKGLDASEQLDEIGVQIHQAQQMYTKAQVEACSRDDLDGSRGTRYPQSVNLGEEEGSSMGDDGRDDEDCHDSVQLAKFYSLTATVLDRVAVPDGRVVVPVVISREEAEVVNYFLGATFILGRSGTGKTTCLVYKLVGRYISAKENGGLLRQVLLTRSERLVEKLRDNTDGLIKTKMGKLEEKRPHQANDSFAENTRKSFLSLTDEDFPLVCTFDYLLRLIENSIREQENRRRYLKIDSSKFTQVIDFKRFKLEYWQHLPSKLKRGIPVDLAFLEIMGVIKGSISSASNFEPLSREEYLGKRWRLAPNFASMQERAAVYDIYEWYERKKKKLYDIDQTDRVIKVMKALETFKSSDKEEDRNLEKKIRRVLDEIYVDEVQDQRTLEIGMLLRLVGCPRGIHFAGDTAQCISKDALFRFENAKALFHELFSGRTVNTRELKPTLLPLSHNFRSHKRILRVASLVMELLYKGFPELVDRLPPEIGDIPGPQPTLYIGTNIIDILKFEEEMETPQKSDAANGNSNEFGGLRVILVRDEETQEKLRSELGKSSLVLTILQSKGMEFDDVLLYDFLSTSPYNYKLDMLEELLKRRHHTDRSHADWTKDNIILCSELKNLYVGVTRARNRLWILESSTSILDPVQSLFNRTATLLFPGRYPSPMLEILREQDIGVCPEP